MTKAETTKAFTDRYPDGVTLTRDQLATLVGRVWDKAIEKAIQDGNAIGSRFDDIFHKFVKTAG